MGAVNTLVITGYGTNSHLETAHAARLAGADRADVVHFSDIVTARVRLDDYHFLIFPGGFLDGDDLGAAQTASLRWRYLVDEAGTPLIESLTRFLDDGKLVLGICNGFQLLVKLGVLPSLDGARFERQVSLSHNDSARYEDRWVSLRPNEKSPCVFTRGLGMLAMPVRHGEGKLVTRDAATLQRLQDENLIALQYADPATGQPTQEYPLNPNGSPLGIAGLTDPSGRVLGFLIFDATHGSALLRQNLRVEYLAMDHYEPCTDEAELNWQALWKRFFRALTIQERRNERLQMGHVFKRFWPDMCEMQPDLPIPESRTHS